MGGQVMALVGRRPSRKNPNLRLDRVAIRGRAEEVDVAVLSGGAAPAA